MKKILVVSVLIGLFVGAVLQGHSQTNAKQVKPLTIGETHVLHSKSLNEDRIINVYLPLGYHPDSAKTYPVIYLLDGSMHEDFLHIVGLTQFVSYPWINILPESIVVGISNVDRKRDFTFPTSVEKDKKDFPTTGGSAAFIQFLSSELIPFVNNTFRVSNNKTLIGQSLGGLLATEVLFTQSTLFNNYLIISPSLWWDKLSLLKKGEQASIVADKVYVAVGKEGKIMEKSARDLTALLRKKKVHVSFEYFGGKNHADILHQAVYNGFIALSKMSVKK